MCEPSWFRECSKISIPSIFLTFQKEVLVIQHASSQKTILSSHCCVVTLQQHSPNTRDRKTLIFLCYVWSDVFMPWAPSPSSSFLRHLFFHGTPALKLILTFRLKRWSACIQSPRASQPELDKTQHDQRGSGPWFVKDASLNSTNTWTLDLEYCLRCKFS